MNNWTNFIIVTWLTWMTPLLGHRSGWFTVYGGPALVEANAAVKEVDLSWAPTGCGMAVTSPSMMRQIVWVRPKGGEWVMCYAIDSVSRLHWHDYVIEHGYLGDLPRWLIQSWGSEYGVEGEIFLGVCPPGESSRPSPHTERFEIDTTMPPVQYSGGWPFPAQQKPLECNL